MDILRADQLDTTTTVILDVRSKPGKVQIRGALRYNGALLLAVQELALPLDRDRAIAVYGDNDHEADSVVKKLRSDGFKKAARLEGGLNAWIDNGLPTENLTQDQPIPGVEAAGIRDL